MSEDCLSPLGKLEKGITRRARRKRRTRKGLGWISTGLDAFRIETDRHQAHLAACPS
jgi:hypothetical protein